MRVHEFDPKGVACFGPEYPAPPSDDTCRNAIATMPGSGIAGYLPRTVYGPAGAPGVETTLPAVWSARKSPTVSDYLARADDSFAKAGRRCVITAFTDPPGLSERARPDDLISAASAAYWICVKRGFSGVMKELGRWLVLFTIWE